MLSGLKIPTNPASDKVSCNIRHILTLSMKCCLTGGLFSTAGSYVEQGTTRENTIFVK